MFLLVVRVLVSGGLSFLVSGGLSFLVRVLVSGGLRFRFCVVDRLRFRGEGDGDTFSKHF